MGLTLKQGVDIPDVTVVVQWKVPKDLCTLMQRFGWCARDTSCQGVAILIAEPKWFYSDPEENSTKRGKKRKIWPSASTEEPPLKAQKSRHTESRLADVEEANVRIVDQLPDDSQGAHESAMMPDDTAEMHSVAVMWDLAEDNGRGGNDEGEGCADNEEEMLIDETELTDGILLGDSTQRLGREEFQSRKVISSSMLTAFVGGKNLRMKTGTKVKDIDNYLKLFINAHHLPQAAHCRHIQSNQFFGNNSTCFIQHFSLGYNLTCLDAVADLSSIELCCDQCRQHLPPICCDLCHPSTISQLIPGLNIVQSASKTTCKPKQVKVAPHTCSMAEESLVNDLNAWCNHKVRELFGDIDLFTPNVFLHTYTLLRIVDLAHACQLCSTDDLKKQTSWCFADEYGDELITLVLKHYPTAPNPSGVPSPFISTPLHSHTAVTSMSNMSSTLLSVGPPKSRAQPRCGDCGLLGHCSKFSNV